MCMYLCNRSSEPITGSLFCNLLNIFIEDWVKVLWLHTPRFRDICKSVNRKYIVYYIFCICEEIKGKGMWVSSMGVMSVQGMCPHKIYLGTCTCMFKIMNAREGGVGVKYGGTPG